MGALGLAVAFVGAGMPGPAEAAAPANFDFRKTPDVKMARAWAKERAVKWNERQFTKPIDKKYGEPSTGAGVYAKYGLDKFSPIDTIPRTTNGTYPIKQAPVKKMEGPLDEALKPLLYEKSKYGNFYSKSSPYPYIPR